MLFFQLFLFVFLSLGLVGSRADPDLEEFERKFCAFNPATPKNPGDDQGLKNCTLLEEERRDLKAVIVIFRHGAKAPLQSYEWDPYQTFSYNGIPAGHLTPEGKLGSRRLGTFLQCRYGKGPLKVKCLTSDTERNKGTAKYVLSSLKGRGTKRCTVIPKEKDVLLQQFPNRFECPLFKRLFLERTLAFESRLPPDLLRTYLNLTRRHAFMDVFNVKDTVKIQHCQFGLPLPPWYTPSTAERISELEGRFGEIVGDKELQTILSGPLLTEIMRTLERKGPPRRMTLYSAHDFTIMFLLHHLRYSGTLTITPPKYNGALFFELYKNLTMKILYRPDPNGKMEEIIPPFCPPSPSPCTLQLFLEGTRPLRTTQEEWEQLCNK